MTLGLVTKKKKTPRYELTRSLIIVCEGVSDRDFFRKFIRERGLTQFFDVPFPHERDEKSIREEDIIEGGKTRFPRMLQASTTSDAAKGVLLVIDTAEGLEPTLSEAQGYIREANMGYGVPSEVMALAAGSDAPSVAIAMMPPNEHRGLETLCYRALAGSHPAVAECIENLCVCADIGDWTKENQDKARLQCAIAVLNKENPNGALRYVLRQKPPFILLADATFDPIESMLREFAKACGVSA